MNRAMIPVCMALLITSACNDGGVAKPTESSEGMAAAAPVAISRSAGDALITDSRGSPVAIDYRIIGQPVVGQPVAIDLSFKSALGARPLNVSYRINDVTALKMPESQPSSTTISPTPGDEGLSLAAHQVTVIPMREGRLYLNVAAQIETDTGSWSSVTAVPIEAGAGSREPQENGDQIRSLPAKED